MAKGVVFDSEEFAVHDGPGIRTTVFLKGCPLRCNWCHNPEGLSFKQELMVSLSSCMHCGKCLKVCGRNDCDACGRCVAVCPLRLRRICGTEYEAEELAKILLKNKKILENSGGGFTISGGEPLAQPKFLFELIRLLRPAHVAIETSAYAAPDIFSKALDMADLIMMDLKHADSATHKKYTGVGNEIILDNLKLLCDSGKEFILRIPLIPGVNDSDVSINATLDLVKEARKLKRVELLPYHKTAGAKYAMVNKKYSPLFNAEVHPAVRLEIFKEKQIEYMVL